MNAKELKKILDDHAKWPVDDGGKRADLRGANLWGANLRDANLRRANLWGANLRRADLRRANLWGANLRRANLWGANLRRADLRRADLWDADLRGTDLRRADLRRANLWDADLRDADLRGANLRRADLRRADLRRANLWDADLRDADLRDADLRDADLRGANLWGAKTENAKGLEQTQIVPQTGAFDAWKKCNDGVIVKLRIPAKAKRSNATGRKCRAEFVKVLEVIGADVGITNTHGPKTEYRKGETVHCSEWNDYRWVECGGGIHFYITREEAENH